MQVEEAAKLQLLVWTFGKRVILRRAFSHPARLGFALKVLQLLFLIGDSPLQHFSEVRPVGALLRFRLAPAQYMAMTMESVTQVLPAMEFKALKYHHVTVHWLFAIKQVAEMVQDTLNHQEEAKEKTLADILVCRVTIATPAMSGGDYCQWLFFILPSWGDHDQKQAMSWWRGLDGHETLPGRFCRIHLHGHQQTCVRARWGLEWVATRFDGMWWPCPKKGGLVWESLHILSLNLRSCQDAVNLGSTSKKVGTFFRLNLAPLLADHAFRIWLLAKEDFISKWQDLSRS